MLHTKHKVKQGLTTEVQTRTSSKFKSFGSETNNRFESWAGPGYGATACVHAEGKITFQLDTTSILNWLPVNWLQIRQIPNEHERKYTVFAAGFGLNTLQKYRYRVLVSR